MKKDFTPLVDEHLKSLGGMQEAETDPFFYTRLKAMMEKKQAQTGWSFKLKPVWVISTLLLLLAINGFILSQQFKTTKTKSTAGTSSIESFAKSYNQTISSSY